MNPTEATQQAEPAPKPPREPIATPADRVADALTRLRGNAKVLAKSIAVLKPLANPRVYDDRKRSDAALRKARKTLEPLQPPPRTALAVLDELEASLQRERDQARSRMSVALDARCRAAGLAMRVVRREPDVVLRIAPLAVTIDFAAGSAELGFAGQALARCRADADAIVAAHAKAMKRLQSRFEPEVFFARCLGAWQAARAVSGGGERVELLDFLPYLAVAHQPKGFRVSPTRSNFRDYDRAQLAFDVLRLRRSLGFAHGGWRLNLGVATGTSAQQKQRVIYFEDEDGVGEFKLTVFFTREEVQP